MKLLDLNRYQAFAYHLCISLVLFAIILLCITQFWYPGILFDSENGWKAIGLIIGIDLILGPLLTLIVFNPKKVSLRADLSIIACVQILALAYGSWIIHTSRPLALAYINNSFTIFYANADSAEAVKERIKTLGTNQFFYVFNDNETSKTLNIQQLEAYDIHAQSVAQLKSAYITESLSGQDLFIQIDPLASPNRFLVIDKGTGAIKSFTRSNLESSL